MLRNSAGSASLARPGLFAIFCGVRPVNAKRVVRVNERGLRIGEDHHNAKLSDADVELMLLLRLDGWGYRRLAAKFECSKRVVRDICAGKRRGQVCAGHRVVRVAR